MTTINNPAKALVLNRAVCPLSQGCHRASGSPITAWGVLLSLLSHTEGLHPSASGQHPLPSSPCPRGQVTTMRAISAPPGQTDSCSICHFSGPVVTTSLTDVAEQLLFRPWHRHRKLWVSQRCLLTLSPWSGGHSCYMACPWVLFRSVGIQLQQSPHSQDGG